MLTRSLWTAQSNYPAYMERKNSRKRIDGQFFRL
jgi:hypothetical protein